MSSPAAMQTRPIAPRFSTLGRGLACQYTAERDALMAVAWLILCLVDSSFGFKTFGIKGLSRIFVGCWTVLGSSRPFDAVNRFWRIFSLRGSC